MKLILGLAAALMMVFGITAFAADSNLKTDVKNESPAVKETSKPKHHHHRHHHRRHHHGKKVMTTTPDTKKTPTQ